MQKKILHLFFLISITLKAIDSFLETIGGILILASPASLNLILSNKTIEEILTKSSFNLSPGNLIFIAIYLVTHGIIKLGLIAGLLKKKLWTYIAAEIIFSLFVAYQIYRFIFTHSVFLIALTALDLIVIALTFWEYKNIKNEI